MKRLSRFAAFAAGDWPWLQPAGGARPTVSGPDAAAAFCLASAAKFRAAYVPAAKAADSPPPDLDTPEGASAFCLASAAKLGAFRGARR